MSIGYIAELRRNSLCSSLESLAVLAAILPIIFILLGLFAAVQVLIFARFEVSVILILMHFLHFSFLIFLFLFGNTYCEGQGLASVLVQFASVVFFGVIAALLPVPIMFWQIRTRRKQV